MDQPPYCLWLMVVSAPSEPSGGREPVPVGVLGVDERQVAMPKTCIGWLPEAGAASRPWRHRLAMPPTPGLIHFWLLEGGPLALVEVPSPRGRMPLAAAVYAVLAGLRVGAAAAAARSAGYGAHRSGLHQRRPATGPLDEHADQEAVPVAAPQADHVVSAREPVMALLH